jgi:SsrA-binding protein
MAKKPTSTGPGNKPAVKVSDAPAGTKRSEVAKEVLYNKKLRHDYHVVETWEAGLVLMGSEVKSIRAGDLQWGDAHARPSREEMWLYGLHIGEYRQAGVWGHQPQQPRKLLLHAKEILKMSQAVAAKGMTLIPERLLLRRGLVKIAICLCKGKTKEDQRSDLLKKAHQRDVQRELGRRMKGRD